ncbi:response regulator transcription factor [Anaerocolumna chitinilytica]|uniref:Stage 0 sporulation protein A homolog n=1 Tax=Anaerocolumna chitinilytica TaxID=1727145 RepID=A0A7I8DJW4_9FIRM|nr:response regulator transcription factor [Anaerocolumna chitinilytica]BCJ98622.1 DNA-binding response regulator [Anaerocolumna chitinilytica]
MKTILIIEDDENLNRGIAFAFEKDGYTVKCASTIKAGEKSFIQYNIDLIILDLGLPDGNGIDFCKSIRDKTSIPIIMLTARDMEIDEVSGLMSGADDYITKPFSLSILRARVEALFRRMEIPDKNIVKIGKYQLDTSSCKFYRIDLNDIEEIPISSTEYRLLNFLMVNAGQILSKEQILAALWDNQGNFVDENTLPVNISRLRTKIEDDSKKPRTLKTIYGMGYIWVKE